MKTLLLTLLCVVVTACCSADYVIHEIPELGDAHFCSPKSINNQGEILGLINKDDQISYCFWSPRSGLTLIEGYPSETQSTAVANMNNFGMVVGSHIISSGWLFTKEVSHGFLWTLDGGFLDLGAINGKDTYAVDCDDQGKVVLISEGSCYIWKNGITTKIDNVKGIQNPREHQSHVVINNRDQIAFYQDLPNGKIVTHDAKIYSLNTYESRSLMDNHKGVPYITSINDYGTVSGVIFQFNRCDGFITWPSGSLQVIENFIPCGINIDGIAVGASFNEASVKRATIFNNGSIQDLMEMSYPLDPTTADTDYLVEASDINDRGEIVAVMTDGNKLRTVLLRPFELISDSDYE